jgi:hypothetical protein
VVTGQSRVPTRFWKSSFFASEVRERMAANEVVIDPASMPALRAIEAMELEWDRNRRPYIPFTSTEAMAENNGNALPFTTPGPLQDIQDLNNDIHNACHWVCIKGEQFFVAIIRPFLDWLHDTAYVSSLEKKGYKCPVKTLITAISDQQKVRSKPNIHKLRRRFITSMLAACLFTTMTYLTPSMHDSTILNWPSDASDPRTWVFAAFGIFGALSSLEAPIFWTYPAFVLELMSQDRKLSVTGAIGRGCLDLVLLTGMMLAFPSAGGVGMWIMLLCFCIGMAHPAWDLSQVLLGLFETCAAGPAPPKALSDVHTTISELQKIFSELKELVSSQAAALQGVDAAVPKNGDAVKREWWTEKQAKSVMTMPIIVLSTAAGLAWPLIVGWAWEEMSSLLTWSFGLLFVPLFTALWTYAFNRLHRKETGSKDPKEDPYSVLYNLYCLFWTALGFGSAALLWACTSSPGEFFMLYLFLGVVVALAGAVLVVTHPKNAKKEEERRVEPEQPARIELRDDEKRIQELTEEVQRLKTEHEVEVKELRESLEARNERDVSIGRSVFQKAVSLREERDAVKAQFEAEEKELRDQLEAHKIEKSQLEHDLEKSEKQRKILDQFQTNVWDKRETQWRNDKKALRDALDFQKLLVKAQEREFKERLQIKEGSRRVEIMELQAQLESQMQTNKDDKKSFMFHLNEQRAQYDAEKKQLEDALEAQKKKYEAEKKDLRDEMHDLHITAHEEVDGKRSELEAHKRRLNTELEERNRQYAGQLYGAWNNWYRQTFVPRVQRASLHMTVAHQGELRNAQRNEQWQHEQYAKEKQKAEKWERKYVSEAQKVEKLMIEFERVRQALPQASGSRVGEVKEVRAELAPEYERILQKEYELALEREAAKAETADHQTFVGRPEEEANAEAMAPNARHADDERKVREMYERVIRENECAELKRTHSPTVAAHAVSAARLYCGKGEDEEWGDGINPPNSTVASTASLDNDDIEAEEAGFELLSPTEANDDDAVSEATDYMTDDGELVPHPEDVSRTSSDDEDDVISLNDDESNVSTDYPPSGDDYDRYDEDYSDVPTQVNSAAYEWPVYEVPPTDPNDPEDPANWHA